ncbi:hypothetical protein EW146_g3688 [Bondarzewia mesenterica]|uniref:F-box domain-containing protein n=1 Tax=Bondarzewia mesenterica TaxID=1095465 RepID=A0A4S4M2M4_9AGAM|nr:hypothetical protein EW146_g3688 [Bondarzewia mesenterica]
MSCTYSPRALPNLNPIPPGTNTLLSDHVSTVSALTLSVPIYSLEPPTPPPPCSGDISLPNETLTTIFDHLSPSSLTQAILVSQRWRAVAERVLYSSVVITEDIPPRSSPSMLNLTGPLSSLSASVPSKTLRCCETLSAYPHLAETVRRFYIRWQTDSVEHPVFLLIIAQNIMKSLLPTFTHLESLELFFGLASLFPSLSNLFPTFSLPSLRQLSISGMGESPERLLRNHPRLLHFKLADYYKPLLLAPDDIPDLYSFRGYPVTAASILPGRPRAGPQPRRTPIRSLDLSGMSVTPTLLRDISRHLAHIEQLKVKLALRHTLHFALSGIRLLAALTTVLGAFHNLRRLDLSPTHAVDGAGREQPCRGRTSAVSRVGRRLLVPSTDHLPVQDGVVVDQRWHVDIAPARVHQPLAVEPFLLFLSGEHALHDRMALRF